MLLSSSGALEDWVEDAKSMKKIDAQHASYTQVFKYHYLVLILQAEVRRYLAVKRALEPGTGVLYLAAKRRFEQRSQQDTQNTAGRNR